MDIRNNLGKAIPSRVRPYVARFYYDVIRRPLHWGDQWGIIGPSEIYDESYYRSRTEEPWISEGDHFSKALFDIYQPQSVIDFGCGVGNHLKYFSEQGVEIKGVDGSPAAKKHAVIDNIEIADLRKSYETTRKYDLVLSIEVAEHIPEKFTDSFIETLSEAGETIIMTAAPPGQQGIHHVNCQERSYWIDRFSERGYTYEKDIVQKIRENLELDRTDWITENIFAFESK